MNTYHPLPAAPDPGREIGVRATPRGKVAVLHADALGLCSALLLARQHEVVIQDDRSTVVQMIRNGWAPADDPEIQHQLDQAAPRLRATQNRREALSDASLVVVSTPTSFTRWRRTVDTSDLDRALRDVAQANSQALVVIESTVPVGYTRIAVQRLRLPNLLAMPTRLRSERAFFDRQHPAALIVGGPSLAGAAYVERWLNSVLGVQTPCLLTGSAEAEAIHLLNRKRELRGDELTASELDAYATRHGLDVQQLFEGMSLLAHPSEAPTGKSWQPAAQPRAVCEVDACRKSQPASSNQREGRAEATAFGSA
jgi:UDPglucose 6-dehydrogenase